METYYIVPSTKTYYETKTAESPEEALVSFAEGMDMDMSAYFKAVTEKPITGIHTYEYPEGDFCVSMAVLADTLQGNEKTPYYDKEILKKLDASRLDTVELLQKTYDNLHGKVKPVPDEIREAFDKILGYVTGNPFADENEGEGGPWAHMVRVHVDGGWASDIDREFDKRGIKYDVDGSGRMMVHEDDLEEALSVLHDTGYDTEVI